MFLFVCIIASVFFVFCFFTAFGSAECISTAHGE